MSQVFCYFFKNYTFIINISGETLQMENEVNYADLPDELFEQIETFIKTELPGDIILTIFSYNFDSRMLFFCKYYTIKDHLYIEILCF